MGEELQHLLGRGAGQLLDASVERRELLADGRADLGIGARRVSLELDEQQRPIGQQAHVGRSDGVERAVAALDRARDVGAAAVLEREPGAGEAAPDDREEEVLLRPEQLEDVRLRDAGPPGDRLGGRADQPAVRELLGRRCDDRFASLVGGHPGPLRRLCGHVRQLSDY